MATTHNLVMDTPLCSSVGFREDARVGGSDQRRITAMARAINPGGQTCVNNSNNISDN